ncbi:expressed unknown protein [Seminavis robusta]|uniref:Uncharacterized protein n=1 Tax=Seminavis robusta TaxID=568900 RepID=A0A9N8EEM5_9STRA|nr:expressed unknown protein [Seminavis robusta]|eukprot:Sro828_g208000.1 n/a (1599) ;mRNA; r:31559-36523
MIGNNANAGGDPGGVRDERIVAPDAPATTMEISPAGMELTFQADDPAAFVDSELPDLSQEGSSFREPSKKISFKTAEAMKEGKSEGYGPLPPPREKPTQFREQFDHLMTRLEDRFQNERLGLEEKHSRELEEAMGYFSLSSGEREAKQQELQMSLLEDIGNMAQQLQELTGTLGADEAMGESLTLPSDPNILEEYAKRMHHLEDHFQREKMQLEQKHASEMEEALGTLKMSREHREAKQVDLQNELSAELGGVEKQLEELNRAKEEYEAKMGNLKRQLSQDDRSSVRPPRADPKLKTISRRLSDVERERDAAKDELRRLKLALQVTQGDAGQTTRKPPPARTSSRPGAAAGGKLSSQEGDKIASLRGRIEAVERDLKEAAQTPGGSSTMKRLREKMKAIEKDLDEAEESTKEHFALEHLRARMEKVEKLLTEGERAAKDWEALEELRHKIGNVDSDLKAVEEAKKEFEALEALRSKMEAVESELKIAEQLANDRENVDGLRQRLGQVERDLGVAEPPADDHGSIDKLLHRLARAETTLEDARASTKASEIAFAMPSPGGRSIERTERDEEVEKILNRLALAERKLKAAKESALRRNPSGGFHRAAAPSDLRPQSATPFDERQSRIRARLQEHLDEASAARQGQERQPSLDDGKPVREAPQTRRTIDAQYMSRPEDPSLQRPRRGDPYNSQHRQARDFRPHGDNARESPSRYEAPREFRSQNPRDYRSMNVDDPGLGQSRAPREKFEESRPLGGFSRDGRYYVEDVHFDRATDPLPNRHSFDAAHTQPPGTADPSLAGTKGQAVQSGTLRPLRRRRAGDIPGAVAGQPKSTNYSVLGDDEDRYKNQLEELKYQRALLSQKLKKAAEEEKKAEDQPPVEPKFSFKEAIRNERNQQSRGKLNPTRNPKPQVAPKKAPEDNREAPVPREIKTGGDPPIQPPADVNGDPPVQVPSLGDDLKSRILARPAVPGRDPTSRDPSAPDPNTQNPNAKTTERGVVDPPDFIDPPATARRRRRAQKKASAANPSDESGIFYPVKYPEPFYDAGSISTAELPTNYEPERGGPPKRVVYVNQGQSSSRKMAQAQDPTPVEPSADLASPPAEQAPQTPNPARAAQGTQSEILQPPGPQKPVHPPPPTPPPPPQSPPSSPLPPEQQAAKPSPRMPANSTSSQFSGSSASESQKRTRPKKPSPQQPQIHVVQPPTAAVQQPIFHQTTVVDGKAAARERREKDQMMRWVIGVLLCLAIVLAAVILVVVVLLRNGTTTQSIPSPAPAPTPSSTSSPTFSTSPPGNQTLFPTGNGTGNATMFPSTMFPTTEGSNSLEQCPPLDSITPLTPNGITQQLSTVGTSFDPTQYGLMSCGIIGELAADGVWFAMIGDGDVVTISTCTQFYPSFDTQLVVFTPVNQTVGCREGLECVTSNDNFCGQQSSVTFIAQENTLYFVYVSGMTAAPQFVSPTEGDFSLTVSTSPEGSCQGAIGPLVPSPSNQLPVIVVGDLLGGTFGVDPCNPDLQTRTGEFWYKVTGTGTIVAASTCHALSNFQARLAVYSGLSCDVLMCVTANDEDCGNGSEINWFAEAGTEYYLLVYTPVFVPDSQFGITIQEIF